MKKEKTPPNFLTVRCPSEWQDELERVAKEAYGTTVAGAKSKGFALIYNFWRKSQESGPQTSRAYKSKSIQAGFNGITEVIEKLKKSGQFELALKLKEAESEILKSLASI